MSDSTTLPHVRVPPNGYGARPVSVDLTRGGVLAEIPGDNGPGSSVTAPAGSLTSGNTFDQLALKHWRRGHRVLVCSLAGGAGRSTLAAAIATTLAGLPFSPIWPPALLVDSTPPRLNNRTRGWVWDADEATTITGSSPHDAGQGSALGVWLGPTGVRLLAPPVGDRRVTSAEVEAAVTARQTSYAPVIVDAPVGVPGDPEWTLTAPAGFSVVLITRPDEHSLAEAADALVWMHDRNLVTKHQVTVVVNHGAGSPTRRTRPAATALTVRCHAVHQLPRDPAFAPGPSGPAERKIPKRQRLRLGQICLSVWHTTQAVPRPEEGTF